LKFRQPLIRKKNRNSAAANAAFSTRNVIRLTISLWVST